MIEEPSIVPSFNVLLVEPATADAERLGHDLSRAETATFSVDCVSTLCAAKSKLEATEYDVILVDQRASDGSGVEAVTRLYAIASTTPIVMLTERHDVDFGLLALKAGAQDYLATADATPVVLERAIRYAIERGELRRRVVRSDRFSAMGQLAAGIAHEINNPTAFVLLNHETLRTLLEKFREGSPSAAATNAVLDEAFEVLEDNEEGIQRIRTLVSDLRSFARVDESSLDLVPLNDVVTAAAKMLSNEIRHRARLSLELGVVDPLFGDRGRLSQVVINLLLNAAQAIDEGAADKNEISVRTQQVDGMITLSILDTGCGIADEMTDRIFDPFFTTKTQDVGTGLGLAICAEVVSSHGGQITVDGAGGHGTRVDVTLPVAGRTRRAPSGARPTPKAQKARMLIIDDEPNLLKAYRRTLGERYDVVLADSGREALALLEEDSAFDIVICDLMMPDFDGLMFYKRVAEILPELVELIVFCTGGVFTERMREFIESVPNEVLYKPITPTELRRFVSRTLEQET